MDWKAKGPPNLFTALLYSIDDKGAGYCDEHMSVCLSVCLQHISETTLSNYKFSVHDFRGHDSIFHGEVAISDISVF